MGYTGEIVGGGVPQDLQALVDDLVRVEAKIKEINGQTISIIVDLKGAENLNRLTALMERQQEIYSENTKLIDDNTSATQRLSQATQQYNTVTTSSIQDLAQNKIQLQYVREEMRAVNRAIQDGVGDMDALNKRFVTLTAAEVKLKAEAGQLNKELKVQSIEVNNTSNSFNVLGISAGNVEKIFGRMILRMVAYQLILAPVIAGTAALVESFGKLSVAEQDAVDRLKDYEEAAKSLRGFNADIFFGTEVSRASYEAQIAVIKDKSASIEAQTKAYNDLKGTMPGIANAFTMEDIANGKSAETMRKKSNYIIELTENLKKNKEVYAQELIDFKKIEETYLAGDQDPTNRTTDHVNAQNSITQAYVTLKADIAKRRQEIIDTDIALRKANPDEIKKKKPSKEHKEFEDELNAEKEHYKIRQDIIKKQYDDSRKTFVEEKQRDEEEKEAAQEHADAMILIIERWHGRVGESDAKYLARKLQVTADEMAVNNAANEDERKIALEIQKRHDQVGKEIDEEIAKLVELHNKLKELKAQDDLLKAQGKASHDYASGGMPFLEALGYSGTTEEIKAKTREIDAAQQELERKKTEHAAYNLTPGATAVGSNQFGNDEQGIQNNIDKLTLDRQKILDDKIIEAKKETAEKAIELAQTTFEAIKTIQENQFAFEQEQLSRKMQAVELHSQQQMKAIDATTNFAIVKDNQKAKLAAQTAAEENALQAKSNELKIKQARWEKQNAEMTIIANTATAIIKTIAAYAGIPGGFLLAAPIVAIEAAIGAAQYAAASSAQLPQFEKGGTTKTPYFRAGEKGAEIGITPSGKAMVFAKDSVYTAPIGTNIKTADETQKLINYAISGIGYNGSSLSAMQEKKEQAMNDKRIVEKLDEVSDNIIQAAMLGRVIKNTVVIQSNHDQQRFS